MCFGSDSYSKSLRTGSMRPSSTQRRRWRKLGLGILQHGTFCCVYLACPLQRQTPGTRWDLNLLQWAVAPQQAWIIYIIGHLRASACSEADAAPAVSRTSEVWWWNGETVERGRIFLMEQVVRTEEHGGQRGGWDEEQSLLCLRPKSLGSKRCWEAFFCMSFLINGAACSQLLNRRRVLVEVPVRLQHYISRHLKIITMTNVY